MAIVEAERVGAAVSLLYPPGRDGAPDRSVRGPAASAATLRDLDLRTVLDEVAGKLAPALRNVLATPLADPDAVRYRQEVFADLRDPRVLGATRAFASAMRESAGLRERRAASHDRWERELWAVRAGSAYVRAVDGLREALDTLGPSGALRSRALGAVGRFCDAYADSAAFRVLRENTRRVEDLLASLRFAVWIRGAKVTVGGIGDEPDLEHRVLRVFERFQAPAEGGGRAAAPKAPDDWLDHVQAAILERVARLNPDVFAQVSGVAAEALADAPDPTVASVADEAGLCLAWVDLLAPAEAAGLPTCLPVVSREKALDARGVWDLPLGLALTAQGRETVTNDIALRGAERILVVSGPNQGGKTTTARAFGQVHHLAALGLPVPGASVRVMLADRVLTVFEREETEDEFGGRLGGELRRLHRVFDAASPRSAIVLNEVFASTSLADAEALGRLMIGHLVALEVLAVFVTFVDDLSRLGAQTVSMVSVVDPADPTARTFKVVRRRADGRAYAEALAARYGLGYRQICERVAP